ncbi:uncharacterized protein BDW70DRAFT_78623 [Aspergillus foveolatus]|uniref:uncharacterized protein n=1 Tax=Aspergillus foveolatus TaxID=210207 RepID=UPI003CCD8FF4
MSRRALPYSSLVYVPLLSYLLTLLYPHQSSGGPRVVSGRCPREPRFQHQSKANRSACGGRNTEYYPRHLNIQQCGSFSLGRYFCSRRKTAQVFVEVTALFPSWLMRVSISRSWAAQQNQAFFFGCSYSQQVS